MSKLIDNYQLRIHEVINKYKHLIINNENIVGLGRGIKRVNNQLTKEPSLTIYVRNKVSAYCLNKEDVMPRYINGIITDIVESGDIGIKGGDVSVKGGRKIRNERNLQGGTLTYAVSEKGNQKNIYILGCNHVMTRRLGNYKLRGVIGDVIKQTYTTGLPQDIAKLADIAPLYAVLGEAGKTSEIDAAIAYVGKNTLENQKNVVAGLIDGTIVGGTTEVESPNKVYSIGAVSGKVEGIVDSVGGVYKAGIDMNDGEKSKIIYENVTVVNMKSQGGDSGAMGVIKKGKDTYGFGMLVAAGATHTAFTSLETTLNFFDIELLRPL